MKYLGLDLGQSSIGWCLLDWDDKAFKGSLTALGSRVLGELGENVTRREKRGARRLVARRKERRSALINQFNELFATDFSHAEIDSFIRDFDIKSLEKYQSELEESLATKPATGIISYYLRAKAIDEALSIEELFRILYSLSIRRGFLSNRKSGAGDDEEKGKVYSAIDSLRAEIKESGVRTLGELYFTQLKSGKKIRGSYTHRSMFQDEFRLIMERQKAFHKELNNEEAQKKLYQALFYQRPLKSPDPGICRHENGENGTKKRRRAPWLFPEAQEFRILQELNNLAILEDYTEVFLDDKQRKILFDELSIKKKVAFSRMRSILRLSKKAKFNLESEKRKHLDGNQVSFLINKIAGDNFFENLKLEERRQLILDIHSYEKAEALEKRLIKKWKLEPESARELSRANFPVGTCNLSLKAMEQLRPHLEKGIAYQTAVKKEYSHTFEASSKLFERLPPLNSLNEFSEVTNHQVIRVLSELRKIVNEIIEQFGKPDRIVIELARELKLSSQKISELESRNTKRQKARDKIKEKIEAEGFAVTPDSIKRLQLAEECDFFCPYTGKKFGMTDLLGSGLIDVEHIIPYSRCFDNSFANLTLCMARENREVKKNRAPFEVYGHDQTHFSAILKRVSSFKSEYVRPKLERFRLADEKLEEFCEKFESRALNDTQYISKLAKKYLALLYGGEVDKAGKRVVRACSGGSTSLLRKSWGLDKLLSQTSAKNRGDHRHHALDAAVIAVTGQATIQLLSDAAKRGENTDRLFKDMALPWPDFRTDLKSALAECLTSHRKARAGRGALHEETVYSKRSENLFTVKKPLSQLSLKDLAKIEDKGLKRAIEAKLKKEGGGLNDPKKAFAKLDEQADPDSFPKIGSEDKGSIVKAVKIIRNYKNAIAIKGGEKAAWVLPGANHRMEIYKTEKKGKAFYVDKVISRFAHLHPEINEFEGKRPELTIFWGDIFQVKRPYAGLEPGGFYRVKTVSPGYLAFIKLNDARMKKEIIETKEFFPLATITKFMEAEPIKLNIDRLGRVKKVIKN